MISSFDADLSTKALMPLDGIYFFVNFSASIANIYFFHLEISFFSEEFSIISGIYKYTASSCFYQMGVLKESIALLIAF